MGDGKNRVTARNEPLRAGMNPERWQQVKSLLATALESHPSQRCAYLDQACGEGVSCARNWRIFCPSNAKLILNF
jgi:hypothetical protein